VAPTAVVEQRGTFVGEVGVGIVHHVEPWTPSSRAPRVVELARAVKMQFDPLGRLNPGIDV
jgi:FAD/FMN-containing dehydrogenase